MACTYLVFKNLLPIHFPPLYPILLESIHIRGEKKANFKSYQPDLISFNADSSQTTLSTSYQQIALFSKHRMDTLYTGYQSSTYGPAYWVTGKNNATGSYLFKAAVYNVTAPVPGASSATTVPFRVSFPQRQDGANATLTVLTSPSGPYGMNTPAAATTTAASQTGSNAVSTAVSTVVYKNGAFAFDLPQWSVAVLVSEADGSLAPLPTGKPGDPGYIWGQCGGVGYVGPECMDGLICVVITQGFSQCQPANS
jgi:hypothetical protein